MLDQQKLIQYMAIEFVGVLLAVYFILCVNSPATLQNLGLPILFQGDMNYIMAGLAFAAFASPLAMFLFRSAQANKDN